MIRTSIAAALVYALGPSLFDGYRPALRSAAPGQLDPPRSGGMST
jgi:hypothetical protein